MFVGQKSVNTASAAFASLTSFSSSKQDATASMSVCACVCVFFKWVLLWNTPSERQTNTTLGQLISPRGTKQRATCGCLSPLLCLVTVKPLDPDTRDPPPQPPPPLCKSIAVCFFGERLSSATSLLASSPLAPSLLSNALFWVESKHSHSEFCWPFLCLACSDKVFCAALAADRSFFPVLPVPALADLVSSIWMLLSAKCSSPLCTRECQCMEKLLGVVWDNFFLFLKNFFSWLLDMSDSVLWAVGIGRGQGRWERCCLDSGRPVCCTWRILCEKIKWNNFARYKFSKKRMFWKGRKLLDSQRGRGQSLAGGGVTNLRDVPLPFVTSQRDLICIVLCCGDFLETINFCNVFYKGAVHCGKHLGTCWGY